jgi:hypothetical protein
MAPDAATDPSQPPTTHLSASHSINQIKSNDKPVSTLHAIAHAQNLARVTPKRRNQTAPQVPDAVIPPHTPATLRRSRKSQRDDSDTMHVQASARHTTTTTTANSEWMPLGTHMQNSNTTTLDSRDVG